MSFYRNRDIYPSKFYHKVVLFIVLTAVVALLFRRDFSSLLQMGVISGAVAAVFVSFYIVWQWLPARMRVTAKFIIEKHRREQGRLTIEECKKEGLLMEGAGLPLGALTFENRERTEQMVGLTLPTLKGHLFVAGATQSGKGMHLTQTLLSLGECAAVVVDPKGEQYERTAGVRAEIGPIYRIPGNSLNLADYYNLSDMNDLTELHYHMMKPWADKQSIFANKVKFVFAAAAAYAQAHRLNPIQVLLDAAKSDPGNVLNALAEADYDAVMNFTNGDEPDDLDKFAASSWGSFGTRMFDYQQHWHTITQSGTLGSIPLNWAAQKGTIYITYSFDQLKGVGGVVSAIVAALLRYQKSHNLKDQMIAAVDELPAVGLNNVDEYLATVAGYGISMILYVQSYSQLADIYGERKAETILSNCQHQVWYPPADQPTARRMSELYGTKMEPFQNFSRAQKDKNLELDFGMRETSRGISMQIRPALAPEEMGALTPEEVIVQIHRRYVSKIYRLWPVPQLGQLPPPAYEIESMNPIRPIPNWSVRKNGTANKSELQY